jgi:hypothetical protein
MEARRGKQLVIDHTLVMAIIFGIIVSAVTVIITLALTGGLSELRQASADTAVGQSASLDLDFPASGTENFGNLDRLDQNPNLMVWKSMQSQASAGLTDEQFLLQSTIAAKSTAYESGSNEIVRQPGYGTGHLRR